ncbi:SidA/IucD/PvdA family monooxygenase [Stenotrophomonas maltophilia]
MDDLVYDVVGVGFGVSNIGAAIAMSEAEGKLSYLFFESKEEASWQPGMLLSGSDIQNSPHRDLITPINPRSRFTFINYLHEKGRLFEYFNLGRTHPFRLEYADYIKWCASFFSGSVNYSSRVDKIEVEMVDGAQLFLVTTESGAMCRARNVIVGTGRQKNIPGQFLEQLGRRVFHSNEYLESIAGICGSGSSQIAVVGSSQSAIEIVLDIRSRLPKSRIINICRGSPYRLKNTSQFSYESFYPEFIDFYYSLPLQYKREVLAELRSVNYGVADEDVISQLYGAIYEDRVMGVERVVVIKDSIVERVERDRESLSLLVKNKYSHARENHNVDYVVLATGFIDNPLINSSAFSMPLLEKLSPSYNFEIDVNRDYSLKAVGLEGCRQGRVYLNGLCEATHGFGDAGSISSVSIRCKTIVDSIARQVSDGRPGL